jgi:hypothetical protein
VEKLTEDQKKQKQKQHAAAYEKKLYRGGFAIRVEFAEGAKQAIEASGASGLSEMLAKMSLAPEEVGAALKVIFDKNELQRPARSTSMKSAISTAKDSGMTPAQIEEAIKRAVAEASQANG